MTRARPRRTAATATCAAARVGRFAVTPAAPDEGRPRSAPRPPETAPPARSAPRLRRFPA